MTEISHLSGLKYVILDKFDEVINASYDCILIALCFDSVLKTLLTFLLSARIRLELYAQAVIFTVRV